MFGWLTKKLHKKEDYDDIRSQVLGEPFPAAEPFRPEPFREPPRAESVPAPEFEPKFEARYGEITPKTQSVFEPFSPSIDQPPLERTAGPSRDYEIMDRLNLIESQLAAIRSMSETINERLKNMESRLGLQRRY